MNEGEREERNVENTKARGRKPNNAVIFIPERDD